MLLQPITPYNVYPIDKMIFRLPEEYGYPAVSNLDKCVMSGKVNINIPRTNCKLDRVDGATYVTLDLTGLNYDHTIKIVSIIDSAYSFTAPELPGTHY